MICSVLLAIIILTISVVSVSAASYVLGDADNDKEVASVDVTLAQRVMVYLTDDEDGGITLRADVDRSGDLEITDVTWIQRYLALMDTPYPIDEVVSDEAPTEAPTQAPTQKPTSSRDPYELPPV